MVNGAPCIGLRMLEELAEDTDVFLTALGWVGLAWTCAGLAYLTFGQDSPESAILAVRHGWELRDRRPGRGHSRTQRASAVAAPPNEPFAVTVQANAEIRRRVRGMLVDYAAGTGALDESVPLDLACRTDFQRRVMLACRRIPYGATCGYRNLAEMVGAPQAARAVGGVMARNPVPLFVPCHRVLAAGGHLGGFSAPQGLAMKRRLLELEAAHASQFA